MPTRALHDAVEGLGERAELDAAAASLTAVVKRVVPPQTAIKDALSGTWLGHPLHPLLTDIPIGCFTSASILDLVGGARSARAADRLLALGLLSAVPTVLAGAADWSDTSGATKRIGVVHAAANAAGLACYGLSALARRRGRRARGVAYALAGMTVMSAGGYLGGHLISTRGAGVNTGFDDDEPVDWTPADQAPAVLVHAGGAIGARCTHAGGDLREGEVDADACTVTCPLHDSVFRLDTGAVVHGPATVPQPVYETRTVEGRLEVRRRRT